jgi:pantoate--beta-alanine ligase
MKTLTRIIQMKAEARDIKSQGKTIGFVPTMGYLHEGHLRKQEGVDYLFLPGPEEMFHKGHSTYVDVYDLKDKLCGRSRPIHFRGVCMVVLKLFNIVSPDVSYFGQKDAQQAIILKRMVEDLNLDVRIDVLPIIREKDGLALSTRNEYLNRKK